MGSGTGPGRPNQGEQRSHWVPGVETLTSRGRERLDRQGEGRGGRDSRTVLEPHSRDGPHSPVHGGQDYELNSVQVC